MLASNATTAAMMAPEPARRSVERRRHPRFPLVLLGRYMRTNKQEFPCRTIDVSVGGIAMATHEDVEVGERIIAYFDELGGVEGIVARTFDGGFALALTVSARKREKLAAQITWLLNSHEFVGAEARRHARLVVSSTTNLVLEDGAIHQVRCLDASVSGASVATTARPPIGAEVTLGRFRGRVIRHHGDGIAVQFMAIQRTDAVKRYLA
ncbi:MAG: PilZ domain-containing protein [Hyphomicrobiaceae bacterium]